MQSMVRRARGGIRGVVLGLGLVLPAGAAAQYEAVPQPAAYALQDVTVIRADGQRQEGLTVVVRGELIEAMGGDVAIPADAELLEGDSLILYPGFVDGDGEADFEFPEPEIDRRRVEIWNAPRVLRGFTPSREVMAHLASDGEDVEDQRKAGIVAGAVHPDEGMMAGRGVLLLYRGGVEAPSALVIDPLLGPVFTFRGGQGVYPGTLFGVTASIRQAFEDARHRALVARAHARNPQGMTAPAYDPDYAVLQEVLEADLPVYFAADDAASILRVLGLADEYGFRPVIVGGEEAWKVASELRRRDVPVLVSTDFTEPRQWDPDEEEAGELDAAAEREKAEYVDRWSNAGRLAEAGVTFALTSGGSGEILEGARKTVSYGLSEDDALAALTTTPANLFGVPHIPRLDAGYPATFIVADGPVFDEDSNLVYTFVEGFLERGRVERAAGSADAAVSFGGTWDMTVDAEGQTMNAQLDIEQEGATFTGTMTMMGMALQLTDGVINGNRISVVAEMEQGGQTLEIEITGTVEGDQASGEANAGPMGVARWEAKRTGPGGEV
jgi:imidazolonepropionase-like amidohydrolase